jgi:hypothetical protein
MTLATIAMVAAMATATPNANKAVPEHGMHGSLDGMTFEVTLVKPDGTEQGPDTLIFRDGTFDSVACHAYNFGKSSYTAVPEAAAAQQGSRAAMTFESTAKSDTDGMNVWKGKVMGRAISGTLTWTDAKGKVTVLTFSGHAKPDQAQNGEPKTGMHRHKKER